MFEKNEQNWFNDEISIKTSNIEYYDIQYVAERYRSSNIEIPKAIFIDNLSFKPNCKRRNVSKSIHLSAYISF